MSKQGNPKKTSSRTPVMCGAWAGRGAEPHGARALCLCGGQAAAPGPAGGACRARVRHGSSNAGRGGGGRCRQGGPRGKRGGAAPARGDLRRGQRVCSEPIADLLHCFGSRSRQSCSYHLRLTSRAHMARHHDVYLAPCLGRACSNGKGTSRATMCARFLTRMRLAHLGIA